jgi:hypothetical protein
MQVETYEVIGLDVAKDGSAFNETVSEEALALIEQLNLDGQRQLVTARESGSETVVARNPYRLMTLEESRVYGLICDQITPLGQYGSEPLPLRILQVAAHAESLFERLEVWHPSSERDLDPLLVGVKSHPKWTYQKEKYLLARWGPVLVSFDEMRQQAASRLRARWEVALRRGQAEIGGFLAGIDANVATYLYGQEVTTPSVSL